MSTFGVQKTNIYGSYGEFSVGSGDDTLRARYLLTKIRPGAEGSWENELASQMTPWREVFRVEELSFDELVQRDLDDSRVAHDLIPYLLASGDSARFFPPILAVLAPRKPSGSGIEAAYPEASGTSEDLHFGDLFDFRQMRWGDELTPLAQISFNRQKAAFVIVDGQHRAMAVLALHRQLTDSWANNAYSSYYSHIPVENTEVRGLELPVCLVFFPDLHAGNVALLDKGIDLGRVCRELFLVVNRHAKQVSASRELLLDDDDIAARLMRQTLSKLKNRGEHSDKLARIYSFAYGDSDESGKQVVSGRFEYSTAVALHKLHCAVAFGHPEAFSFSTYADISDQRYAKNPNRPANILLKTRQDHHGTVSRKHGKIFSPQEMADLLSLLGEHADPVILGMFDSFRPFSVHNTEMRRLRTRLSDPTVKADPIQQKCFTLLFEGSGARAVFESHVDRLRGTADEAAAEKKEVSDYVSNQIDYSESVLAALGTHEQSFRRRRACALLGLDHDAFFPEDGSTEGSKRAEEIARSIYQTISTQAFQLGFAMAILTSVEVMLPSPASYEVRQEYVKFVTNLYLDVLNSYFSPGQTLHKTLKGLATHKRISVFDPTRLGLRGLLRTSVSELNERQWPFFRYAVLEIVHSKYGYSTLREYLHDAETGSPAERYRECLPTIVEGVLQWRSSYVADAINASLRNREFGQRLLQAEAEARGAGKTPDEIQAIVDKMKGDVERSTAETAKANLKASLGAVVATSATIVDKILGDAGLQPGSEEDEEDSDDDGSSDGTDEDAAEEDAGE